MGFCWGGHCPAVCEQREQSRTTDCPHGQTCSAATVTLQKWLMWTQEVESAGLHGHTYGIAQTKARTVSLSRGVSSVPQGRGLQKASVRSFCHPKSSSRDLLKRLGSCSTPTLALSTMSLTYRREGLNRGPVQIQPHDANNGFSPTRPLMKQWFTFMSGPMNSG